MEHLRLQIPLAFGDLAFFLENQAIYRTPYVHDTPNLTKLEHVTLGLTLTSPTVVMQFRHACSPFH